MKKLLLLLIFLTTSATAAELRDFHLPQPVFAPNISFSDAANNTHSLIDFKGKVVLLNFWATWCKPCVAEMPSLARMQEFAEKKNIEIIPISIDFQGAKIVQQFYKDNNIEGLRVFTDKKGNAFKELKLQALPTTLIIDRNGKMVAKALGEINWDSKETREYLAKVGGR